MLTNLTNQIGGGGESTPSEQRCVGKHDVEGVVDDDSSEVDNDRLEEEDNNDAL
jgi:hypothetical protein